MSSSRRAENTTSGRSVLNSVVAGYTAGVSGTIIGHPIDSMKVWAQTRPAGSCSKSPLLHCATTARFRFSGQKQPKKRLLLPRQARHNSSLALPSTKMLRTLYAGVSGPLVSVGVIQAINFCVYDSTRRYLHQRDTGSVSGYLHDDSMANVAWSGAVVGSTSAFVTSPLMHVKVKQQVAQVSYRDAAAHAVRWRGCTKQAVRNLYTGFFPHALSEVAGRVVYFSTYEYLKRFLGARRRQDGVITLGDRMVAASSSGVACWCVIYPLDAMRSRMFATSKKCVVKTAHKILAEGGWKAFYRGLGITLLRAGPVHAFVLPIYDLVLAKMSDVE